MLDFGGVSQSVEGIVSFEIGHHSIEIVCDTYFHIDEELGFFNNVGASLISTKAVRSGNGDSVSLSYNEIRISCEPFIHFRVSGKFGVRIESAHRIAKAAHKIGKVLCCVIPRRICAISAPFIALRALVRACAARSLLIVQ